MADHADLLGTRDVPADSRGRIDSACGETSGLAADRAAAGAVPGEGESGVADPRIIDALRARGVAEAILIIGQPSISSRFLLDFLGRRADNHV